MTEQELKRLEQMIEQGWRITKAPLSWSRPSYRAYQVNSDGYKTSEGFTATTLAELVNAVPLKGERYEG
jgi:hypothetical protein